MNISLLGATGSIGRQALEVLHELPDVWVSAMAADTDYEGMAEIAKVFRPDLLAMYDKDAAAKLQKLVPGIEVAAGMEGLIECVRMPDVKLVINAVVGSVGLVPTMAAIESGRDVALANKETLVAAGSMVMQAARENNVCIRPIDSEHSAIWQCLHTNPSHVSRLILTASGGAFRDMTMAEISKAKASDALRHPVWNMGQKITIDCATMMNKGLEYIEAHWLFDIPYEDIDILIHPQSLIHSMVEYEDGAVIAQLGSPDMRQPIQYALSAPVRHPRAFEPIDFSVGMTFDKPDLERFPCLALAMEAAKIGGTMPAMMNAVNESLVTAYLSDKISFYDISGLIEKAMETYNVKPVNCIADVQEAESWAGEFCDRNLHSY